ncbi:MAG: HEAT repeat domain-containing protein, partial [Planctomycetota bacterium]
MRRVLLGLIALGLVLTLPAGMDDALAHGGQYRGPAGEVPPDSRQPEDPPPPDSGGGTPTPPDGPGGTPTPPDGGGTPTPPDSGGSDTPPDKTPPTGGDVPGPTGGPQGGTKTGGKLPTKKGPSYESWLFWWNYNKDEIINIKSTIRAGGPASSGDLGISTTGTGRNESEAQNITARTIEADVVPTLKEFARNSKINFDIQSAAVLALAKVGRKEEIPLMMSMAKNDGNDKYHKVVEESAALALGIMQDRSPAVRKFLSEIASDTDAKIRTRCFSMYALGLLGEPDAAAGSGGEVLDVLKSLVAAKESSTDIANSALIAIGLLGDPAATPDLLQWLREEKAGTNKLSDLSLSYVAGALGKIGQPGLSGPDSREVVDALRDQLKRKNRKTRYSTVIALGQVAPQANAKIQMDCVKILSQVVKGEGKRSDTQTVNYGLAALGRIAGVEAAEDGSGGTPAAVRDKAIETLLRAFDSNKTGTRNFAALGLGIAARVQDAQIRMPIQERIRNTLARTSGDVEKRGAMIISLGMLKDRQAAPLLQKLLEDRGLQKELRGTAAVALGLMGERKALPAIRAAL